MRRIKEIKKYEEIETDSNAFQYLILKNERYFEKHKKYLNPTMKQFSIEHKDKLNEITFGKTFKGLYCATCDLYDCGIHSE